jgi:hypothetical protein
MNAFETTRLWILLMAIVLLGAGCQNAGCPGNIGGAEQDYEITGPYEHQNLSVFLIHSPSQDDREFITLDQGLKEGWVKVTEKQQEQVGQLQIENQSDYPLFLQEGDRLQGGKQDRIIIASLVVPAQSGQMTVPAFCIEQGRWVEGERGVSFDGTGNKALAPKATRMAAKFDNSQQDVWQSVLEQKLATAAASLAGSSTSSLNEALESPQVKKISDEFAEALQNVLDDHEDAVGVAIVINGNIEEVNVYPNHSLLKKLYPRLLQSYALQATLDKEKAKDAKPVATDDIARFMNEDKAKSKRKQTIDAGNAVHLFEVENDGNIEAVQAITLYKGVPVHRQVMAAKPSSEKK